MNGRTSSQNPRKRGKSHHLSCNVYLTKQVNLFSTCYTAKLAKRFVCHRKCYENQDSNRSPHFT